MIKQYDVLYSIDGFVVGGKKADYLANLLIGEEASVCHLVLLRGEERLGVQVSLQRARPLDVPKIPTIQDIALQFDDMERRRLADLMHFLHNFSTWHREVHKWLQSTVRNLNRESCSSTPGTLSVSARGQLLDDIRIESICARMVQTLRHRQLITLSEYW